MEENIHWLINPYQRRFGLELEVISSEIHIAFDERTLDLDLVVPRIPKLPVKHTDE